MSTATKLNIQELAMRQIRVDHSLQARVETKAEKILEYTNDMIAYRDNGVPDRFPPVVVFFDGKTYWLADGFHRFEARKKLGAVSVTAYVREGTKREAILHAVSANLDIGFRPSSDDKKKAVRMLLSDPEYFRFTDKEIGNRCGVNPGTVGTYRRIFINETGTKDDGMRLVRTADGFVLKPGDMIGRPNRDLKPRERRGNIEILAFNKTHYVCRATDPDKDTKIFAKQLSLKQADVPKVSLAPGNLRDWFVKRSLILAPRPGSSPLTDFWRVPELSAPGLIIRVEAKLTPRSLPAALGDVLLWRQANDPKAAAVVVCYPDDDVKDMIRHAKALGVEFLTPHEVVERFATKP